MKLRPSEAPKPYKLRGSESCLCGSGQTFGNCCSNRLPGFEGRGKLARRELQAGNWQAALAPCRADLTQYTIWHKTNTVTLLARGSPAGVALLNTDLLAMAELLHDLCLVYGRLALHDQIPAMLERVRANIADARWQKKVTYFHAFVNNVQDNKEAARSEFKKLGPLSADETDIDIWTLYIDVFGDDLSFSDRLSACDNILRLTKSEEDAIQYNCLKAFNYLLVGDIEAARKAAAAATANVDNLAKLSVRGRSLLANALSLHASLTPDKSGYDQAVEILSELKADDDRWTPLGLASLEYDIGDCRRYEEKWPEAEGAYRRSLEFNRNEVVAIFLAECVLEQDRPQEAADILDSVLVDTLDKRGKSDHAYASAAVALTLSSKPRIEAAIKALQHLSGLEPYFEQRRLALIVKLQSAQLAGTAAKSDWREFLRDPARAVARYAILQPTFFGFGLNINAMLEDSQKSKKK